METPRITAQLPVACSTTDLVVILIKSLLGNLLRPGPKVAALTENYRPATSGVARTKVGSVAYGGAGIYDCTVDGTLAITFDDGPYIYTSTILDVLEKYNVTAT